MLTYLKMKNFKICTWDFILNVFFSVIYLSEFQVTASLQFTNTVENLHTIDIIAILGKHGNLMKEPFEYEDKWLCICINGNSFSSLKQFIYMDEIQRTYSGIGHSIHIVVTG